MTGCRNSYLADPRKIRMLLRALVLWIVVLGVIPSVEAGPMERVRSAYDGIREIEGAFRQVSRIRELDQEQRGAGRFYVKRPDRVRWDYFEPSRQSAIIVGSKFYAWQEGNREVWDSVYDEKSYGKTPLVVLSGLGSMERDFQVSVVEPNILTLVPKEGGGFIKEIRLTVQEGKFPIRTLQVTDLYGNENEFEFSDVQINQGLSDELFSKASLLPAKGEEP